MTRVATGYVTDALLCALKLGSTPEDIHNPSSVFMRFPTTLRCELHVPEHLMFCSFGNTTIFQRDHNHTPDRELRQSRMCPFLDLFCHLLVRTHVRRGRPILRNVVNEAEVKKRRSSTEETGLYTQPNTPNHASAIIVLRKCSVAVEEVAHRASRSTLLMPLG